MLSLAPLTLKQIDYYLKMSENDYYAASAERPGVWLGDVARQLCGGSQIVSRHFERLMRGLHPQTQVPLIQLTAIGSNRDHQPGTSMALSAPKTVSTVWGIGSSTLRVVVENCHAEGVDAAIRYCENNLVVSRRGHGGRTREPVRVIAASFLHGTSRNLDPQLHTHVLLLNVGQRADGSFGTVVNKPLYDHQKEIGAIYRAALAVALRRDLGVRVEFDSPEVAKAQRYQGFRLVDVPKELESAFSSRRKEIVAAMKARGVWGPKAAEYATLDTRRPKRSLPLNDIREYWKTIAAQHKFGPEQVEAILYRDRKLAVKDPVVSEASRKAVDEALDYIDLSRVSFDRTQLLGEAALRSKPGVVPVPQLEADANKAFEERKQRQADAGPATGSAGESGETSGRRHDAKAEAGTAHDPGADGQHQGSGKSKEKKQQSQEQEHSQSEAQDATTDVVWTRGWEKLARTTDAMSARQKHRISQNLADGVVGDKSGLSAEQMKALHHITTGTGGFAIVDGLAGTGKTLLLHEARRIWEAAGKTVVGAALSGKATRELEAGSGIASRTIRSVLWHTAPSLNETLQRHVKGLARAAIGKDTGPLQPAKIDRNTVLVIDESSLVSLPELNRLAKLAEKRGAKLVLVGDRRQLEAIVQPGAYEALIDRHGAAALIDIRRQQQEWMRDAVRQAALGDAEGALIQCALAGRFHGAAKGTATEILVSFWKRERTEDLSRTLAIANTKEEVEELNRAIQKARRQEGELGWLKQRINGQWARRGDRVILASTSRRHGFSAGDTGVVKSIGLSSVTVRLDRQRRIPILGFQMPIDIKLSGRDRKALMLGYAVTTFRSQGMSVDRAFILHGGGKEIDRATYVQLSRAVESVRVVSTREQLSASIRAAAAYAAQDERSRQKQWQKMHQQKHQQEMRP